MTSLAASALLLVASGCADRERPRPIFPPSADLEAAIEAKPVAGPEIVTSERAAEAHAIAVEGWGERVSQAGGRLCRWAVDTGAKLPFACPARPKEGN